jgi:polyphosphate glucokinase
MKTPKRRRPREIVQGSEAIGGAAGHLRSRHHRLSGMVRDGKVMTAPNFGTEDWKGFRSGGAMRKALAKPVKLLNDADVQGMAVIKGKGLEAGLHPWARVRHRLVPRRRIDAAYGLWRIW